MPRVRVGVLTALLALAAIAVWRFGLPVPSDEPPSPPAQPNLAPATAAQATEADAAVVATPPAVAGAADRVAAPRPASNGLRILVCDRSKRPVAGAAIEVKGDDELSFPPTGADGTTEAPRLPNGDVSLIARTDDLAGDAGWRWTSTAASEVKIWMNRHRDVEVLVTDRAGSPHLGASVGLFAGNQTGWRTPSMQALTDGDGLARFRVDGAARLAAHATVQAVAGLGGAGVTSEPIAWAEPGPTRVTVVLDRPAAPTGPMLWVRFVDRDGAPVAANGTLAWSRITRSGAGTTEWPAGETAVDGQQAQVAPLLDGDHLRLHLREPGRLASQLEVRLNAGATAQVVALPRGAAAPRLEIPVIDAAGKPVTSGEFVVTVLLDGGGYERESTIQPDAEGTLAVALSDARSGKVEIAERRDAARLYWPEPQRLERPYRTTVGKDPPPNPPLALFDFAQPSPGETVRLPPVALPDTAPRIHGIVVDPDDKPVAGVHIWLTTVTAPEPAAFAAFATRTDRAGRFWIRATELPDEVFVGGRRPLGFCAPVRVRPGPEPVTLRLQPTGSIALALVAAERPAMPEALARRWGPSIDLRIDDDARTDGTWMFFRERRPIFESGYRDRWSAMTMLEPQRECVFRDLVPGDYRILGSIGDNGVLDIPNLRVVAGEVTAAAAAPGTVLGAGIEAGCVRLHDPAGRPVANARVRLMLPEWKPRLQHAAWCDTDSNGEAWFLVPRGARGDIEVITSGFAPIRLQGAPFPAVLTVGAGTSFVFAISGLEQVRAESRSLVVGCMLLDGTAPESPLQTIGKLKSFRHPQANLDEAGRATVPNLPPGNYRLWLGAWPQLHSARGPAFVLLGDRVVGSADADRVLVEHAVTAAQAAALLGQ